MTSLLQITTPVIGDHFSVYLGLAGMWALLVAMFAVPSIVHIAHLKNLRQGLGTVKFG